MNAEQGARSYVNFEPSIEWSRGEYSNILRINLPGFKRQDIKVQTVNSGNLHIVGEHPLERNQWSRVLKELPLPLNSHTDEIHAKFVEETLIITVPKDKTDTTPSVPNQQPSPSKLDAEPEPPNPATMPEVPKLAPSKPDAEPPISAVPEVPKPAQVSWGLLLSVVVALVALVGIWFYLSFKLSSKGQNNTEEL